MKKIRIHTLTYTEHRFIGDELTARFDLDRGIVTYHRILIALLFDGDDILKTHHFNPTELQEALTKFDLPNWDKTGEMFAPVDDGVSWELHIRYNGNLKRKVNAHHCRPDGKGGVTSDDTPFFRAFIRILDRSIGERFFD